MKKGIVISLAILMMFLFVGCGEKDSIAQQLMGTSWYQTLTTETDLGAGYITDEKDGERYNCDEITLTITSTATYSFEANTFNTTTEVKQIKSGITKIYDVEWVEGCTITTQKDKEVTESTTETESVNGTWNIENDRLYMIENGATTGVSYSVSIVNNELILENEYAGIFLRLKRK